MKGKLRLMWLGCMLIAGLIMAGTAVYITDMQLADGTVEAFQTKAETFAAQMLRGEGDYRQESAAAWQALETYVRSEFAEELGGVFETEEYLLIYLKNATPQLREALQQRVPEGVSEVVLAPCRYSRNELEEARKALETYLQTAPKSVRESVSMIQVAEKENCVAVSVQNWSLVDQLRLARAMGPLCGRLYLVKGELPAAQQ